MSLYTFYITKDRAYIGADSRQGAFYNGEYFMMNDDTEKLFIHNNLAYTFGGHAWIATYIDSLISQVPEDFEWVKSPQTIFTMFKYACDNREFVIRKFMPKADEESIQLALQSDIKTAGEICMAQYNMDKGEYEFYTISSRDNFQVHKVTFEDLPYDQFLVFGGFNNDISQKSWDKHYSNYKNNMSELFKKVYEDAADVYVGGTLHYVELFKGNIVNDEKIPIKDKAEIRTINMNQLLGHNLVGKNLYIVGTKSDGTTGTCRIDGDGVLIDNGSLTILPMNGNYADSNGITLSPDPHEGFKCTGYDSQSRKCFEIKMNGQDGLLMYTLNANGKEKEKMFHANINGQLMTNGDIYCKRLFLQGMNGDIATAMDALKLNDKGNTSIGGDFINAKGIQVKKGSKTTFEVSEDGDVTGRDCVFRDGTFTGTFQAGSITSDTTIDVNTDASIGNVLYLNVSKYVTSNKEPGIIWRNDKGEEIGSMCMSTTGNLLIAPYLGDIVMAGDVYVGSYHLNEIFNDVNNLISNVNQLQDQVKLLQQKIDEIA
jgi:cytoskeletal protein CcmA (bactofilin family)